MFNRPIANDVHVIFTMFYLKLPKCFTMCFTGNTLTSISSCMILVTVLLDSISKICTTNFNGVAAKL